METKRVFSLDNHRHLLVNRKSQPILITFNYIQPQVLTYRSPHITLSSDSSSLFNLKKSRIRSQSYSPSFYKGSREQITRGILYNYEKFHHNLIYQSRSKVKKKITLLRKEDKQNVGDSDKLKQSIKKLKPRLTPFKTPKQSKGVQVGKIDLMVRKKSNESLITGRKKGVQSRRVKSERKVIHLTPKQRNKTGSQPKIKNKRLLITKKVKL